MAGCAGTDNNGRMTDTPTVDYVEGLDVKSAPHKDSFLNQLAMNYRSYAIYNARTSGYPDLGELFAQKAIGAFSGEKPFPESLDNWNISSDNSRFEIHNAYNELIDVLKTDAIEQQPQLAAEAQAKFDCWISALSSGQNATANECRARFIATVQALKDCMEGTGSMIPMVAKSSSGPGRAVVANPGGRNTNLITVVPVPASGTRPMVAERYYPETYSLNAMSGTTRARDGMVIVNNVNIPSNLVNVVPVPSAPTAVNPQPMVFNQNIYGGNTNNNAPAEKSGPAHGEWEEIILEEVEDDEPKCSAQKDCPVQQECPAQKECPQPEPERIIEYHEVEGDYVSRDEFINLMMQMREDLLAINKRLDELNNKPAVTTNNEKTIIKVQQIPLEPKQHIMEEVFEIRFDFDKAAIKPEYEDLIKKLAATTQANKNIKVSVVGHTDTAGSSDYNYALGGRRAEAVQKMLIGYGIPSSQIVAVSAGEEDLKVPTPNNTPNAENRRVRVVKEVHFTEPVKPAAPVVVEEYQNSTEQAEIDVQSEVGIQPEFVEAVESYDDVLGPYDDGDYCEDCGENN